MITCISDQVSDCIDMRMADITAGIELADYGANSLFIFVISFTVSLLCKHFCTMFSLFPTMQYFLVNCI